LTLYRPNPVLRIDGINNGTLYKNFTEVQKLIFCLFVGTWGFQCSLSMPVNFNPVRARFEAQQVIS
jgi:hypothetical protein